MLRRSGRRRAAFSMLREKLWRLPRRVGGDGRRESQIFWEDRCGKEPLRRHARRIDILRGAQGKLVYAAEFHWAAALHIRESARLVPGDYRDRSGQRQQEGEAQQF